MADHETIQKEKIEKGRRFSAEADNVELKGEDSGETGILKRYVFIPNPEALKGKNEDEIKIIVEAELAPKLLADCKKIGWWPMDENKPYNINKMDDGSYMLVSFIQSTKLPGAKFLSRAEKKDMIGINEL